jgi:selenocysteine-specific elongation factor
MYVVATAGHVDHGKSTLVRALTGMEPDRLAEERRRGLTIDLGYAWTELDSGAVLAFVDVPGHQRFIGNMLAGLGPAPAVLFVVAADEGWRRQSEEHLAAVHALGLRHGLLAVTRSDLADPRPALEEASHKIAASSLGPVRGVAVSGATGDGVGELREALADLVAQLPPPRVDGLVRLWIDRSFTIRGAGTVVTGTLGGGRIRVGDELDLRGRRVVVRGLQSLGRPAEAVTAVARVAVNLRGVSREEVRRGDVLLTPDAWFGTRSFDARLDYPAGDAEDGIPADLVLHAGTAALPVRVRPLGGALARLTVPEPVPLAIGDRAVLRDPGRQAVAAGVLVVDPDPPPLRRRGAAAARAAQLRDVDGRPDLDAEIARRGAVRRAHLAALGVPIDRAPASAREAAGWLIAPDTWRGWVAAVRTEYDRWAAAHPLEGGMPVEALRRAADLPSRDLLAALLDETGLSVADGRAGRGNSPETLGSAESSVALVEKRLAETPFRPPDRTELAQLGLGRRELAAAERAGRLLRIADGVVLLPSAPATALAALRSLPQPFTLSEARQALATTRRIAVPLMEYLDRVGVTEPVDTQRRRVR